MASINSIQNNSSTYINFKSHIVNNDFFKEGIKTTKKDMTMVGNTQKGLNTLKAIEGLSLNGKNDFVEFLQKENKILTKVNGKVDPAYTFESTGNIGTDSQFAIFKYAKNTNSFSYKPISPTEEKIIDLQNKLSETKANFLREMHRKLNSYL